jgi:hypothetical protein
VFVATLPIDYLAPAHHRAQKKADMAEHPQAFDHVGLLFNEPPSTAELLFS